MARPALFEMLSTAARVTQVSGPAGSGKTVLIRSWVADAGIADRAAWVTVGPQELDPQAFWLSMQSSLRATAPCGTAVRELTPAPDLAWRSIAERMLEDLSVIDGPLWLIIDDLHELAVSEATEELTRFITHAPETLRIVLSSRRDLQLGLHRLRLEGELTEIRAADLRFTLEEARTMFESAGIQVSEQAVEQLVAHTEGWAAGLRLAALSLARHPDPEQFAAEFSGSERMVAEYLLAEVLARQPPEVGALLLRTSILEHVNGPLAERLTGIVGAERILAELEDAGAFVVSLDPQRTWYRYHRLLADLLALELRRTAPDELRGLHIAAAEWLAEHGHPVDAIRHAQTAENWEMASQLLADHWFGLYLDGRRITGHELLARFPPGVVTADPELALVGVADELAGGSLAEAERYLAYAADASSGVRDDRRGRFEIALASLRLGLARAHNDVVAVAEEAQRLMRLAEAEQLPPGLGEDLRALALTDLGIAETWTGRREDAERHLEQAMLVARRHGRPLVELIATAHLALVLAFRSVAPSEQRSNQAIELAGAHGWSDEPPVGVAYAVLGTLNLWRGRLTDAEDWLDRARNVIRSEVELATGVLLHASRALLHLIRGQHREALTAFHAAQQLSAPLTAHALTPIVDAHALVARVRIGDIDAAELALAGLDDQARDSLAMRVVRATLELSRDQPEAATAALAPVVADDAALAKDVRWGIQALVLEAIARDALRDAGAATRALERSLEFAELDGFVLPFLLFPAPELLARQTRLRTAHASLVAEILNLLAGRMPAARTSASEPLADALSDSELRVLRYLPTNLQAPEIAAELFVSVNTVRTHMRHVYAKLGVHRRAEAVERARDLGLLAPTGHR